MTATVIPLRPAIARATTQPFDPVSLVFGPGGLLARQGRELRDGQRTLAQAIHETITDGGALLAEGPCGTGKSLAYLVPAIHSAVTRGGKVVVATANIALQEQLVTKDLPYLQGLLPWPFTFALLKGRNNYVCLDRLALCGCRPPDLTQLVEIGPGDGGGAPHMRQDPIFRRDMARVGENFRLRRKPFRPRPMGLERIGIEERRHIAGRTGIGVVAPGATDSVLSLKDHNGADSGFLEGDRHPQPTESGADDGHVNLLHVSPPFWP
jgi:hypothetical protein